MQLEKVLHKNGDGNLLSVAVTSGEAAMQYGRGLQNDEGGKSAGSKVSLK